MDNKTFCKQSPCASCPYRVDTPLKIWAVIEFKKLIETEKSQMGAVYSCHKQDGTLCTGWLMQQVKDYLPSIALRLTLLKHNITEEFLQSLSCKSPVYASVIEMCRANYPEHFKDL
jgi:hypothetical protein